MRRSVSMRAGAYAELTNLAKLADCTRAAVIEGMIHAAAIGHGLTADYHVEREAVRETRLAKLAAAEDAAEARGALYFSGVMSL